MLREYCSIKRDIEPYDVSIIECVLCGGVTGREYKQLVELQDNAATTHYFWGQLHDRVYSAQRSGLCLPATLTTRAISDVQEAIRHFSLSLQQSDAFLYHSIIRVTTLWFRVSQESAVDLMATVKEMTEIKSYQWYVVLQQLVSVAQETGDPIAKAGVPLVPLLLSSCTTTDDSGGEHGMTRMRFGDIRLDRLASKSSGSTPFCTPALEAIGMPHDRGDTTSPSLPANAAQRTTPSELLPGALSDASTDSRRTGLAHTLSPAPRRAPAPCCRRRSSSIALLSGDRAGCDNAARCRYSICRESPLRAASASTPAAHTTGEIPVPWITPLLLFILLPLLPLLRRGAHTVMSHTLGNASKRNWR